MDALLRSARAHGIAIQDNSMDSDAVILWSVLWHGRMRANQQIYEHYRSRGRPVIIAEVGALRRNHTWKIAINNVNGLGYYGHERDLDPDRPRRLGLSIKHMPDRASHVLIACQNTHSLQMSHVPDQVAWVRDQIQLIRQYSDRPIWVRPHPRSPLNVNFKAAGVEIQLPRKVPHTYDDFDLDLACHAVVNINSGPGILAALQGTPVIVDETSLAHPVAISIKDIERPPEIDRQRWLIEISHTEYEIPELEQGLWLKRLQLKL
jgi:hypothetical protein